MTEIPINQLSCDALENIIKEFVLREGTDYGPGEYSLEQKIEQVKSQLDSGIAKLVFDGETESFDIIRA